MSRLVSEASIGLTPDSRVDQEAGIIRRAKVVCTLSRNGRTYPPALLAERFGVYEGSQVYADHDYGQLKTGRARPLSQWGGVIRGATFEGGGVYADVHCLRETAAGRIILEAAARMPDRFGLSPMHLIDSVKDSDGRETVTAILECWSVDAVTRPATTRTLFEQDETMPDDVAAPMAPAAPPAPSVEEAFAILQNAVMADADLDDTERLQVLKDVMKLKSKVLGTDEAAPAEGGDGAPAEESERRPLPLGRQARQIDEMAKQIRCLTIRQMAGESLPIDGATMAVLLGLPSDEAVGGYLEQLRRQKRPRFSSGPARSQGRPVGEAVGTPAPVVPRLTQGADRAAVEKYYRS